MLEQVCKSFHWDCLRPYATVAYDHRRIETRSIRVSDELAPDAPCVSFPRGVLSWPSCGARWSTRKDGRQRKPETVYLLTSLPPEVATPQRLLRLNRSYWGIENRVHCVRDVALDETTAASARVPLPRSPTTRSPSCGC